jgi:hypothetical protein
MIADRPELERSIKVKGMYGIEEKEMLAAFEVAMTPHSALPPAAQDNHHVVLGLQPRRMRQAITSAGAYIPWEKDRRFSWLAHEIRSQSGSPGSNTGATSSGNTNDVLAVVRKAENMEDALEVLTIHIAARLARLLMIDAAAVQPTQKSVAGHGLDSMIVAEFRNWIFMELKLDIPFQQLLAGGLTVADLAKTVYENIRQA